MSGSFFKRGAWLGIGAGTLLVSIGLWVGLFVVQSDRTFGLATIGGGIVLGVYGIVAFSGVEDPSTVAFRASLYALTVAAALVVAFQVNEEASYAVAAPVVAVGVGGAFAIPPVGDTYRLATRIVAVGLVTIVVVAIYRVDHTVYALLAPLLPLPAVGLADRVIDRGREIIAE